MKNVFLLTNQTPLKRGWNDFYPLIKWANEFSSYNTQFKFCKNIKALETNKLQIDVLIIDYRHLREQYGSKLWLSGTQYEIISIINNLKKICGKIILFDSGDSSGSRLFWLTPYVDIHLKKQLLKNKAQYSENNGDESVMCWIGKNYTPSNIPYTPLRTEDQTKLKVAWNIGLLDYRSFPLAKYYPIGTSGIFNRVYKLPRFKTDFDKKNILTVYRGTTSSDSRYSCQRNTLIDKLKKMSVDNKKIITGSTISQNKYIKEIDKSKALISPFGWGEVCYRDFESIINGSTYPDIYRNNFSYIEIDWEFNGLESVLNKIEENYRKYYEILFNAQNILKEAYTDSNTFVNRFLSAIE